MPRLCKYCGKPVTERTDREVRFCSVACANKSRRKIFPRPCEYCGEIFQPPPTRGDQKYCSTKCRDTAKQTGENVPCDNCGKPVYVKANRLVKLDHHFCDDKCYYEWRANDGTPRGRDHVQYNRVTVICGTCNKEFERVPSQLREHNFCSVECRTTWQRTSGYTHGKNSPAWNGGHDDYRGPNWNEQRHKALERDAYTCQRCGTIDSLQIHHIKPFSTFDDYKEANRLNNLETLCASCHTTTDWEYRKEHPGDSRVQPDTTLRKVCVNCSRGFVAQGHRAKYCPDCWMRTCPTCGERFHAKLWPQKYCSRQCAGTSK